MGRRILFIGLLSAIIGTGCAQVPKESVELSTTVGRDIRSTYQSHRELAELLFDRIENDVNTFIDEVYAPYQINRLLSSDREDFRRGDTNSLFATLDHAVRRPDDAQAQRDALAAMEIFVEVVRAEIESYRAERLAPVRAQRKTVLANLDRAYGQIIYGNSIVTGYLASVVKVRDAQNEILAEVGLEDLQKTVGAKLAETSDKLEEFMQKARKIEGKVNEVEPKINELTGELDRILSPSD